MRSIELRGYSVIVQPGSLHTLGQHVCSVAPAHRYAIITDSNVNPLYGAGAAATFPPADVEVFQIPAGEQSKSRDSWSALTDALLASGHGRDSAVIALGGGVIGDLAGFVAATFMRGIPVVQTPTTLVAMVDAAIGGKTGVDTPTGKNLVGAFHPPVSVVVDPQVLVTLPLTHLRAGFAEALKHGLVADERYFHHVADVAAELCGSGRTDRDTAALEDVICRSVEIKATIVTRDERESGVRKMLNFGHTVGHAIEVLSGYSVGHGEAVGIGMVLEARAGERAGITQPGTAGEIADALGGFGLPTARPCGPSPAAMLGAMRADKKARSGAIEYALPLRPGAMAGADSGYALRLDDTLMLEILA